MKTFDLKKKYNFTDNVQKNILIIKKLFGTKFKIKSNKLVVNVKLIKNKLKTNQIEYYTLIYDQPKRIHDLLPFTIIFYDIKEFQKNNITYIGNIHKTNKISGSKMVLFVLEIQRKLNVVKTYLHDGATIKCNGISMNLSKFKMIEKFKTFYMKFGFEISIKSDWTMSYKNKKEQQTFLIKLINNIKKIKINNLINDFNQIINILSTVIKNNDYKNFKIQHISDFISKNNIYNYYYQHDPEEDISKIFNDCFQILKILNKTKQKYLYKYLIELFNDKKKCLDYLTITNYFEQNKFNIISYKKKVIKRNYISLFKLLNAFIHWGTYEYIF